MDMAKLHLLEMMVEVEEVVGEDLEGSEHLVELVIGLEIEIYQKSFRKKLFKV